MKHQIRRLTLPAILLASFSAPAATFGGPAGEPGGPTLQLGSPFGPATAVAVILGERDGKQLAVWRNKVTQDCVAVQIGDASLWSSTYVTLSDAATALAPRIDDEAVVVATGMIPVHCRNSPTLVLGRLQTGELSVEVKGGAGRDFMHSGDHPNVVLDGEEGDDRLLGRMLIGGEGNDVLLAMSSATDEILDGGPGSDCVQDANRQNASLACGEGDDAATANGSPGSACERVVERCLP